MSVKITLCSSLARLVGRSSIDVESGVLIDIVDALDARHPGFRRAVYSESRGDFRGQFFVMLNDDEHYASPTSRLQDGDRVDFGELISGG